MRDWYYENRFDCCNKDKEKDQKGENGEYIHSYSGVPKEERSKRGVSAVIKKKLERNLKNFEAVDEKILRINKDIFSRRITLLGISAPNNDEIIEANNRNM